MKKNVICLLFPKKRVSAYRIVRVHMYENTRGVHLEMPILPPGAMNGDWHPERMFIEAGEQDQNTSPGASVQHQGRSSTHFPPNEYTSRPIDWNMEDTWRIPVVGGNIARQSLFKSVLRWLKRT